MPTTYQTPSEGVNPQPGYYAVIPVKVLRCKDLPPSAKLLYGDISALCSVEGYSWASNAYLAGLYNVDESTVRRWLAALVKQGFLTVIQHGPNRRIYLSESAPKRAKSRAKTSGLPAQKCAGYPRKNAPHSITLNKTLINTSEDVREGPRFVGPGPVPARDLARVEQEGKGSASPPPPMSVRKVERAVAAVGDHSYRGRFRSFWEVVEASDCADVWQNALDAVKSPPRAAVGPVERSGAYFCSVLVSGLKERGVSLPESLLSGCGLADVMHPGGGRFPLLGVGEVTS